MKHLIHLLRSIRDVVPAVGIFTFAKFKLSRKGKLIKTEIDGDTVLVRSRSADLNTAVNNLRFEYQFIDSLSLGSLQGQIVDAGAYIGTSALAFRKKLPDLTISCIEPSKHNLSLLKENLSNLDNLHILEGVLGPKSGITPLFARKTGEIGNSVVSKRPDSETGETAKYFVESFSLQDILDKNGPIAILKMDIEGGERAIFENNKQLLATIPIIICELHERVAPGVTESMYGFLSKHHSTQQNGEKVVILNKSLLSQ